METKGKENSRMNPRIVALKKKCQMSQKKTPMEQKRWYQSFRLDIEDHSFSRRMGITGLMSKGRG